MRYSGDVTLPDGRTFHVMARFGPFERDTNSAGDVLETIITTPDGEEVDLSVYNEEIDWPGPHCKDYLWSVCVDLLTQEYAPDDPDDGGWE